MPTQNDRVGDQPGQRLRTWVKQQAPVLKPLLARGKAILARIEQVVVEQSEEPAAGPPHSTRAFPQSPAQQNQVPLIRPPFPGGNATRTLPETVNARAQMPVAGPFVMGGSATRTLPETAHERAQAPVSGPLPPARPLPTGQLNTTKLMNWPFLPTSPIAESATQRVPVVIKASMKRPAPPPPPLPPDLHKKRRIQMALVGLALLGLITLLTLFTVTPLGHEVGLDGFLNPLNGSVLTGQNPGVSNPIAQATATAIYHRKTDGYDPSFFGSQLIGDGIHSLIWPLGQCTYWSNYEYHRLTGHWVSWNGNADQWVTGARKAGWNVSQTPHSPSIMVMMPNVQGASGYGHVAVVEGVSGNVVHTSNMNWWANGGGWNRVSNVDFYTGRGIYFVWHS